MIAEYVVARKGEVIYGVGDYVWWTGTVSLAVGCSWGILALQPVARVSGFGIWKGSPHRRGLLGAFAGVLRF